MQGNVITSEQAALIKPGMTRAQVRDVLGSPLLDRPRSTPTAGTTSSRSAARAPSRSCAGSSCCFKGEGLESIDTGGELPGEREFVASIDTFKTSRNAPPLALTEEQLKALPEPREAAASAEPAPPAPARTLPAARAAPMTGDGRRASASPSPAPRAAWAAMLIEAVDGERRPGAGRRARCRRQRRASAGRDRLPRPQERRPRSPPTCAPAWPAPTC